MADTDLWLMRQQHTDPVELMQTTLDGRQAQIHTAMPGQIVSFDPKTMTATVQPALQFVLRQPEDGTQTPTTIKPVQDVPVHFPGGGGHLMTFPIKPGDDCLLIFAERQIDNWFESGGVRRINDWRMHDISDAIALVGVRSKPAVPSNVSTSTVQLRSDDGVTVVEIDGANQAVKVTASNVTVGASGGKLGVLGTAPVAKPTMTGATGNAVLKELLQFLQSRGDLVDNTT
jgi:hypothetical protein